MNNIINEKKLQTIHERFSLLPYKDGYKCSICLEKMEQSSDLTCIVVQTKCCGKLFHDRCLREHLCCVGPPKCPLCRYDMRDFSTEIIG